MKLSIITINRNNADGLRKTIESVFTQTYADIEYIVIDGASTDDSVSVIKEFEERNTLPINWVSEKDNGVYEAMNKGIEKASGEYCLFLNSGDYLIASDVLEQVMKQSNGADILCARCNVSNNGKVVWKSPYLPSVSLRDLYFVGLPHQATFIRRSLFDKYGLYREDFRYNSDIDFWYKSIVLGDATTQGIDIITTDYNLDGISTKNSHNESFLEEHRQILSQGFLPKVMPDYNLWKAERTIFNKYLWIEQHKLLQHLLNSYRRICTYLNR